MKKILPGLVALVFAIGFSAFTKIEKTNADLYYWYEQAGHTYVGSSTSPGGNPLGCSAIGSNCVKGYLRSSQPASEPTGTPNESFAFNK
jgi:hypothetical protein